MSTHQDYNKLEKENFINLTTYKRNSEEKSTPVWFTNLENKIFVFTDLDSWKVRRIKNNPAVLIAASKYDGSETGPRLKGSARILSIEESPTVISTFKKKYGLQFWFFNMMGKMRGAKNTYIEISPAE
jgi:PPOX class probable F420-dependent enzyme